ncbi:MAG: RNHCP domain-containing protein [Verrucomicrobiota bacterium]|nr:RNHCP domain-containing protein [Verrucomicrobiota bacterium]
MSKSGIQFRKAEHARQETDFRCRHCGTMIPFNAPGTRHRNHCPRCLWSLHLDDHPGDRLANCGHLMEPIAISLCADGEWLILHRCCNCHVIHANRAAGDDHELTLMSLAARPLANPPFPLV